MLAFSIDYYGIFFGATQSVELFCTYVEFLLKLPKEQIMQSMDLCIIMGHAIDNAIEGAQDNKRDKECYIEMRGKERENFYLIQIVNSTTKIVEVLDNEFIKTSKENKR